MKPSVSIVYTEISVLQTLDKILTAGGFQTYPYYSPEEALAWAQFRHPDIYLINLLTDSLIKIKHEITYQYV